MEPWTSIWIKTRETVDYFKDSNWVEGQGLLIYFIFGINMAGESKIPAIIGYDSSIGGKLILLFIILFLGLLAGVFFRAVWVNLTFYFGKIWRGQATKRNVDTVMALCLIPEVFRLINLILSFIVENNLENVKINNVLTIICGLLTFKIFVIGLSRVQKFGYGFSILNVLLPQLALLTAYYSIQALI
jgi:hypothetical protein